MTNNNLGSRSGFVIRKHLSHLFLLVFIFLLLLACTVLVAQIIVGDRGWQVRAPLGVPVQKLPRLRVIIVASVGIIVEAGQRVIVVARGLVVLVGAHVRSSCKENEAKYN